MSKREKKQSLSFTMLILTAFLLVTLVSSQQLTSQNNQIQYSPIGQTIYGQNTIYNQGKGYLVFQIQQLEKKYLFLNLNPSGESAFLDIDMYIYRGTETNPFKTCKKQQVDSCFIPQSSLTKNSQILVIVDCKAACKYDLKLSWSNLEHLKPGDNLKFIFDKDKTQLYHLQLEKVQSFAELRLIIKPQTRRQMFDKVKIYGKYGTDTIPTAQNYDFVSMHLWQDAQGIYLYEKELRSKNMNILVVGSSQTVYVLTCELVNKTTLEIRPGSIVDEYLEPQQLADYHINFTTNGKIEFEQYVFKFAGFNGNMSLGFYLDQQCTKPYSSQPYEYMSDAQFTFQRQQVVSSLPKGIYVRIKSNERISTYTMQFIGRSKQSSIEIKQNIYEITQIEHGKPQLFFFNSYFVQNQEIYQDKYSFTLHLINVRGKHGLTVRVCTDDFDKCIKTQTYLNFSKQVNVGRYDEIGTKRTFKFQVPKSMVSSINQVEQKLVVLVVVENIQGSTSVCALEYYSDNKYQILRQSRPIQTRLKAQETKLFKFTNVDKSIEQVRVHVNKISGIVNVLSLRQSPEVQANGKKQTSNIISFKEHLTQKSIYLILFAEEDAIVSINVQLMHENYNYIAAITMQEDIEFKIKLPPRKVQFLEIHPVYDAIYFDYESTGMVMVCQYEDNQCKKQLPDMGIQGSIEIQKFQKRTQMIMIQNPSMNRTVEFTAIYHSSDYQHCQAKQTGKIYSEVIQNTECYSFSLTKQEQLDVIINRLDFGEINTAFLLCNNLIDLKKQDGKNLYKITATDMVKSCKGKQHKVLLAVVSGIKQGQEQNNKEKVVLKIKMIAQYVNQGAIILPDGVAYETSKIAKQQVLQIFYYEVLNKVNTTIILSNKIGTAYFTAKIQKTVDRHKNLLSNTFDFSSNSSNYYQNPVMTIKKEFLESAKCQPDCTLVIKVFSKDKIGSRNDFTIQVTQNYFQLQEHKMKEDFLTKDAISYYSFYNKDKDNSIYIETSDNNKKCTKIILSDRQYPNDSNNLMIEYGNQIVYEKAQNKTYFIAVQAMENCGYSISVSCTKIPVTHLQRGKLGYVKLQQGQVKYFIIHRLSTRPFKILSIHVYGQVEFYINRTTTHNITKLVNQKGIVYDKFQIKGQHKNRLIMDQNLCENCYYILACVAKKNTDTSIYLGDNDSFLSISEKKSINDYFKNQGESLKGYYYDVQDTVLKVKIHSGKLGVKVKYFEQTYEKEFARVDDMYNETFQLKRKPDDWSPALVELTALQKQTLYSIRFQSKKSSEFSNMVDETEVTPGQPNYIYLAPQKVTCLKGFWRQEGEMIMITADQLYQHNLGEMKIQVIVNKTQLKFDKQLVRNILSIKIPMKEAYIKEAQKYSICLSSENISFGATVFQTEDVNILPADVETVAYGKRKYAIRPKGNFLIDVFECFGKATITYSESLKDLPIAKANSLSILGMPDQPHAFKIEQYLTTFLQVDSQMSTIRWIPIDEATETGLGYLQYKVGHFSYSSDNQFIEIEWDGLQNKTETKTTVKKIQYIIYISNETDVVQTAQNCDYFKHMAKLTTIRVHGGSHKELGAVKKHKIKKQDLAKKYPQMENLFVSLVAQVQIQPIKGDLQHYRFFYTKQQIPKDVFLANNAYLDKAMLIGVIIAAVIAFLIVTCVCTKKIFPLLARLKNRLLVQEEAAQEAKNQQLDDVPPPSSERKAIQNIVGTQDKMSDQINTR